MVTQVRIYNYYPQDPIPTAYALATYDDGSHDGEDVEVYGTSSQAYLEVQHTFSSGGPHSVTLEVGCLLELKRGIPVKDWVAEHTCTGELKVEVPKSTPLDGLWATKIESKDTVVPIDDLSVVEEYAMAQWYFLGHIQYY